MKILFCMLFSILSLSSFAYADGEGEGSSDVHVLIAPVLGYQILERTVPYNHTEPMITFGGRVVVGTYELAGEFEVQYGSASESFLSPGVQIDTTFLQTRLGARRVFPITEPVHLLARAGMEGYHYSNTYTTSTGATSDSPSWQFRPYFGGGAIFYLFKSLSLSVEEIYVVGTSWETGFGFRLFI